MIILASPKGWTGPKVVDGEQVEGTWRSHQVPFADVHADPERLALLERWLTRYRPEELFGDDGTLRPELAELPPAGDRRMGANPHANGGLLLRDLVLPDFRGYAVEAAGRGEHGEPPGPPRTAARHGARVKPRPPLAPAADRAAARPGLPAGEVREQP